MARPQAVKIEGFALVKDRLYKATGCKNASQFAAYLGINNASSVTRPFKEQRIPGHWFALIAKKANVSEMWLRAGHLPESTYKKAETTKDTGQGGDGLKEGSEPSPGLSESQCKNNVDSLSPEEYILEIQKPREKAMQADFIKSLQKNIVLLVRSFNMRNGA